MYQLPSTQQRYTHHEKAHTKYQQLPTSIISLLSKILECAVYNELSLFLTQNDLQDPNQSGFKVVHITETACGCY